MAIDQVLASLLRVPVLSGLKPLQITEIGRRAQRCAFGAGETVIQAGEAGDGAYLILSGEAVCRTDAGRLEPVEPGSLLGELAMFVDHVYAATVVARGWVDCLKLERTELHAQMVDDPDLADRLAQVIRARLAQIASELHEIDELLAAIAQRAEAASRLLLPPPAQPTPVSTGLTAWPPCRESAQAPLAPASPLSPLAGRGLG